MLGLLPCCLSFCVADVSCDLSPAFCFGDCYLNTICLKYADGRGKKTVVLAFQSINIGNWLMVWWIICCLVVSLAHFLHFMVVSLAQF